MRYHGWDGDRLVHTEQVDATQPEQRHIAHTVYEPESFTPLVQLSTKASALAKSQVLALMAQSRDEDENGDDNAQMSASYFGECDRSFRRIVTGGLRGVFSAVSVT